MTLSAVVKKYAKEEIHLLLYKVSGYYYFIESQHCLLKQIFPDSSFQSSSNFDILIFFITSSHFSNLIQIQSNYIGRYEIFRKKGITLGGKQELGMITKQEVTTD